MLEAYEIGISLALQDGVSDGIVLIRRDLAALDRAIAATSQNLARLQVQSGSASPVHVPSATQPKPVAQTAASPAESEQQAPAATAKVSVQPSTNAQRRPDASQPDDRSQVPARPTSAVAPTLQNAPPSPQPAISVVSTSVRPSPSVATPQQAKVEAPWKGTTARALPVSSHDDGPRVSPSTTPAAPITPAIVQVVRKVAADPTLSPQQRPVAAIPPAASPPPRAAPASLLIPQTPAASAQLGRAAPRLQQSPAGPAPRHTGHRQHPVPHHAPAQDRGEQPREPAAPPTTVRPSHAAHHTAISRLEPNAASRPSAPPAQQALSPPSPPPPARTSSFAPPPPSSEQTITLQGDIILDGVRLGRWMTSNLARQAARPAAGPTGPDPRQTPLWSGQAQGF